MRRRRKSKRMGGILMMDKKQQNLISLWVLTSLLELRGWEKLEGNFIYDRDILVAVGLEHLEDDKMDKNQFPEVFENRREELENELVAPNQHLARNVKEFADYIGLNDAEQQILIFMVLLKESEGLQCAINNLGDVNTETMAIILATILDLDHKVARKALSRSGILIRSGLLSLERSVHCAIDTKTNLLEGLGDALQEVDITVEKLLQHYFRLMGPAELFEKDYQHVEEHFNMIRDHLRQTSVKQKKGVNILLYGPPGTGKTELAKTVTQTLGWKLYEVNIGDEEKPFNKQKRLRVFQLAQQVLSRQQDALLLFDEIDDLLSEDFSFFNSSDSLNHKAWINKNLENSLVPTIWIANGIYFAERSFIRRFDIVLHLKHPPRSTRLKILKNYLNDIPVSSEWMEQLAENKYIAPAVIARAAQVVRCQNIKTAAESESRLEKLIESTLTAMGFPRRPLIESRVQINYRLGAVNSDHNLEEIVQGLQRHNEGRLCLYGPPGTGKTEFGHHLARELDKPLLIKRSSDLLSPFLGEAEQNIANMFYEATYEKSVLLLDEADGFLRDRREAQRSWEVTQVNELLTQMERYEGVFICSTNLMDSLDPASLRRFDLKIKFDFMRLDQAWDLFQSIFEGRGIELTHEKHWQEKLAKQRTLTPGDFATVVRKSRISGVRLTPEWLVDELKKEEVFKFSGTRDIGFFVSA